MMDLGQSTSEPFDATIDQLQPIQIKCSDLWGYPCSSSWVRAECRSRRGGWRWSSGCCCNTPSLSPPHSYRHPPHPQSRPSGSRSAGVTGPAPDYDLGTSAREWPLGSGSGRLYPACRGIALAAESCTSGRPNPSPGCALSARWRRL